MANTVVNRIIENGSRNLITEHVLYSSTGTAADNEGTLVAPVSKIVTPFSIPVTAHMKVQRIVYNVSPNCFVTVEWVGSSNTLLANLSGFGDMNLLETQGIINDAPAPTDIGFFAQFPAAASGAFAPAGGYTIVLEMVKGT